MSTALRPTAAGVLIIVRGLVLAFQRDTGDLGLPCGKIDPGETAAQAAVRECFEETGYTVRLLDHIRPPYVGLDSVDHNVVSLHLARPLRQGTPTHPHEGKPVWVMPDVLLTSLYRDYNRAALTHFKVQV